MSSGYEPFLFFLFSSGSTCFPFYWGFGVGDAV